jgi:Pyridoxamine 5'-phosphate oxidase
MRGVVRSLTDEQCLRRLASHRVGRVSVSRGALPVVMPVTYFSDGDGVVFRAPLDADFVRACDNAVIAFEVGDLEEAGGWTVHVVGIAMMRPDQTARVSIARVSGRCLDSASMLVCPSL